MKELKSSDDVQIIEETKPLKSLQLGDFKMDKSQIVPIEEIKEKKIFARKGEVIVSALDEFGMETGQQMRMSETTANKYFGIENKYSIKKNQ